MSTSKAGQRGERTRKGWTFEPTQAPATPAAFPDTAFQPWNSAFCPLFRCIRYSAQPLQPGTILFLSRYGKHHEPPLFSPIRCPCILAPGHPRPAQAGDHGIRGRVRDPGRCSPLLNIRLDPGFRRFLDHASKAGRDRRDPDDPDRLSEIEFGTSWIPRGLGTLAS